MSPIGGFFELELGEGAEHHRDALRLNSGRNALEYVLRAKRYRKVYLPFYVCDAVLQPIVRLGGSSVFYHIDERFEPVFDFSNLSADEAFLYVNYFGLRDEVVKTLIQRCGSLIVDNSQAFYSKPISGADTFYSSRKFFGIPDGSYLYTDRKLGEPLETDESYSRCEQLLRRVDKGPEDAYPSFQQSEKALDGLPLRSMSVLTQRLMRSIDYAAAATKRVENYRILHASLRELNSLHFEIAEGEVPMVYPFLGPKKGLREHLLSKSIYVAMYWRDVLEVVEEGTLEHELALNLVPLPIDQRYGASEMGRIAAEVKGYLQR